MCGPEGAKNFGPYFKLKLEKLDIYWSWKNGIDLTDPDKNMQLNPWIEGYNVATIYFPLMSYQT